MKTHAEQVRLPYPFLVRLEVDSGIEAAMSFQNSWDDDEGRFTVSGAVEQADLLHPRLPRGGKLSLLTAVRHVLADVVRDPGEPTGFEIDGDSWSAAVDYVPSTEESPHPELVFSCKLDDDEDEDAPF